MVRKCGPTIIAVAASLVLVLGPSSAATAETRPALPGSGVATIPLDDSCGTIGTLMMNGRGDVVGGCEDADGVSHIALWRRYDRPVDLGLNPDAVPTALNERGHVVGPYGSNVDGSGFLWTGGRTTLLTYPGQPSNLVWPESINNRDQVAGNLWVVDGSRAFLWRRGAFTQLPTPEGWSSVAGAVNDRGQVLGSIVAADRHDIRPVIWDGGHVIDLGTLGGATRARLINDRGQVIGVSEVSPDNDHPFLWDRGRMIDLLAGTGADVGWAADINDSGVVVGSVGWRPVVWSGGTMRYLFPPGQYGAAMYNNDRGDMAGSICPVNEEPCPSGNTLFLLRGDRVSLIRTPTGVDGLALVGMDDRGRLLGRMGNLAVIWVIR